MKTRGLIASTIALTSFVLSLSAPALGDTLAVPDQIEVHGWRRALVRATLRDDDGAGIAGAVIEFQVADPKQVSFEAAQAYTDVDGNAFTVIKVDGDLPFEPGAELTTFRVSTGALQSDPIPVLSSGLAVDGVVGLEARPLEPFENSEQVLVGLTSGGFLGPKELVGWTVRAWSVDPRIAEIGEGLVTRVLDDGSAAVVEFPVTAHREGEAMFIVDFLDYPFVRSNIAFDALRIRRGDCNDDGRADLSDAICMLQGLFQGSLPSCLAASNTNGDASVDISDPIYLLNYLFLGGAPPLAPFDDCGRPTARDESISCETPPASCA